MNLYDSITEDIWSSRKEFIHDTKDDIGDQAQATRKPVPMDPQEVELATRLLKQPSLLAKFIGSKQVNAIKLALVHAANSAYRMVKALPEMPKAKTIYGEVGEKEETPAALVGGKSDTTTEDFDEWLASEEGQREISRGIQVEMEHTNSREIARKIATDHLVEDRKYYRKLKKAGLADELDEAVSMGVGGTGVPNPENEPGNAMPKGVARRKKRARVLDKSVMHFGSPANANMVGTNPMVPGRSAYAKGI